MRFPSSTAFALLGAGLIAISFGLARFVFGRRNRAPGRPAYDYQLQNEQGEPFRYKRMGKH